MSLCARFVCNGILFDMGIRIWRRPTNTNQGQFHCKDRSSIMHGSINASGSSMYVPTSGGWQTKENKGNA